jgi:hypothetical protein
MSTKKRKAPSATPPSATPSYTPSEEAKAIEEAGLPKYLSCIIDKKLPKLLELPTKKWGYSSDDVMPTDDTIKVLLRVIEKVNPEDFVVLTQPLILNMDPMNPQDEEKQQQQFIVEIFKKYGDKKRIYFCVNSSLSLVEPSHQNWICVMTETKKVIRFEPSDVLTCFGIGKFCKKFNRYTYIMDVRAFGLNQIHGCRLNSTILALNHILGISLTTFLTCFCVIKFTKRNIEKLRKFGFTVQVQLREFLKKNPVVLPRPESTRRKQTNYNPSKKPKTTHSVYLRDPLSSRSPFRSKKKSVKLKKSKLKKSKKINKQ